MKKSKLFTTLSLACLLSMGLASCAPSDPVGPTVITGEKGDTGDTGPKGDTGEKGDTGPVGETGLPGSNGQDGEKGDTGEKGDKGETGPSGEDGKDGITSWSNTVLPTNNGYITVSGGSFAVGEEFVVSFYPNEGYALSKVLVNNQELEDTKSLSYNSEGKFYTLTLTMQEGGYVLGANFTTTTTSDMFANGELYTGRVVDAFGNVLVEGTKVENVKFTSGTGSEEDPLVISSIEEFDSIGQSFVSSDAEATTSLIATQGYHFSLNADINLADSKLQKKNSSNTYAGVSTFIGSINGNGHAITVPEATDTYWGFFYTYAGTLENVTLLANNWSKSSIFAYLIKGEFKDINLGDPTKDQTLSKVENNESILCVNVDIGQTTVLTNVNNYINYEFLGKCNSPFIGGYALGGDKVGGARVKFVNCNNYGDLNGVVVGVFVGNSTQSDENTYTFENCVNYGTVTATTSVGLYVGVASGQAAADEYNGKLTGVVNGTSDVYGTGSLNLVKQIENGSISFTKNADDDSLVFNDSNFATNFEGAKKVSFSFFTYLSYKENLEDTKANATMPVYFNYTYDAAESIKLDVKAYELSVNVKLDETLEPNETKLEVIEEEGVKKLQIVVGENIYVSPNFPYDQIQTTPFATNGLSVKITGLDENNKPVAVANLGALKVSE